MNDVQRVILNLFKEFDRICTQYNIPYYAIGGTCIGAIRHKGFIPWDDDMDVAIPIEFFGKFISVAKEELPPYYKIFSSSDIQHYRYLFIKLIDTRTTFIEELEYEYKDSYKGIFLDIMPISGIPNNPINKRMFIVKQHYYYLMNNTVRYPIDYIFKGNTNKKAIWKCVYLFSKITGPQKFNYYTDKWMTYLKKYPFYNSKTTGYVWSSRLSKLIFRTDDFGKPIRVAFEDCSIYCPSNYDNYLKTQFGDYMKLPPEEKQVCAHPGIVDTKTSYMNYIEAL